MNKTSTLSISVLMTVALWAPPAAADVAEQLKQADNHRKAGRYAQAEPFYARAIAEADPNEPADLENAFVAERRLALVYLATDRLPRAQSALAQMLIRHSGHERLPHAVHDLIEQSKNLNKLGQADQLCRTLLAANPDQPQAIWLKMGMAVAAAYGGDDRAVDTTLQAILAEHSRDERSTEAIGQVAWAYRKLQQHDKARRVYQYGVDNLPKRERTIYAQRGIVLCSLELDDAATAAAAMDKLLAEFADSKFLAESLRAVAAVHYRKGRLEQALAVHQYILDKLPASPEALWCQRDIALYGIDAANGQATAAALQKLVSDFAADGRLPQALASVAEYYRSKGNFQDARTLHQQVVSRFPDSDTALLSQRNMILSDVGINDQTLVTADLQILLTQFAKDTDLVPVLCYVADRLGHGRIAQRLMLYQYILNEYPRHELAVRAQAEIGQIRVFQGDTAAAESILSQLISRHGDQPVAAEVVQILATGYYEKAFIPQEPARRVDGQRREPLSDQAKASIQKAIDKWNLILARWADHPQAPMACYYTATAYYQLHEYSQALNYANQMLQRWPVHGHTWRAQMLIGKIAKEQMREGTLEPPKALAAISESFKQLLQKNPPPAAASIARSWLEQHGPKAEGGEQ